MPRRTEKLYPHAITIRTTLDLYERIKRVLGPGERIADWWRSAAEAKLAKVEKERT